MKQMNISLRIKGYSQIERYVKNSFHLWYCRAIVFISVYLGKKYFSSTFECYHAIDFYRALLNNAWVNGLFSEVLHYKLLIVEEGIFKKSPSICVLLQSVRNKPNVGKML